MIPTRTASATSPRGGRAIRPDATSNQIGTGDLLILRAVGGGDPVHPLTLPMVFATVPALVSYGDTAGNALTVGYPVAPSTPPLGRGGPGTSDNPFPVSAGPAGEVVMTLTFWRPQRRNRTAGNPSGGQWIDIGGLTYNMSLGGVSCPQASYSTTDPNLALPPSGPLGGGFTDRASDRPADPTNTLTFTLNLTQCLASRGRPFNSGDQLCVQLEAHSTNEGADTAQQWFSIRRR